MLEWCKLIWMVTSLPQNYMSAPGPHQQQAGEIYTELRNNVVSNVYKVEIVPLQTTSSLDLI